MKPEVDPRGDARSAICDVFLIALSLIAVPLLASSLLRAVSIDWLPVMAVHVVMTVLLWGVTLHRKRLPYAVRAVFVLFLLVFVGLAGVWQLGLVAAAIACLVLAPALGTVLFGVRGGSYVLAATILPSIGIGAASIVGHRLPSFDLATYVTGVPGWTLAILAWLFAGISSILAIGLYNRHYEAALVASRRDAKALEASEREHRSILDNMVDTFYRADGAGRIVMTSPSARDLVGYAPEELVGKPLIDFYVQPDQRAEFLKCMEEGGGRVNDFEAEIHHRDGGTIWVSTNARFWKDADGTILGVEGVIRDITAHKMSEDALRQSQKLQAIGQLTGGVAHDFNNLLGVIIGNAELLDYAVGDNEKAGHEIEAIIKASERGAALTDRLLAFSRRQALTPQPTDVADLVHGFEDMLHRVLGETIMLRTRVGPGPRWALVDPHQLENALLNLAINARDAMPDGGALTIETANVTLNETHKARHEDIAPGDYVKVSVSDTGAGMTDETMEKAFEPFFTTKEIGAGSGLGLSMVYGFAKQSGGHVTIDSTIGAGTTFSLYLPQTEAVDVEAAARPDTSGPVRGTEHVLVIEDDDELREIPAKILREKGYAVSVAKDGAEAMSILRAGRPIDLLFTDVILPGGKSGVDIAREALHLHPSIRILFATGYAERTVMQDNGLSCAPTVLRKPYHQAELLAEVRSALDRSDTGTRCRESATNRSPETVG